MILTFRKDLVLLHSCRYPNLWRHQTYHSLRHKKLYTFFDCSCRRGETYKNLIDLAKVTDDEGKSVTPGQRIFYRVEAEDSAGQLYATRADASVEIISVVYANMALGPAKALMYRRPQARNLSSSRLGNEILIMVSVSQLSMMDSHSPKSAESIPIG